VVRIARRVRVFGQYSLMTQTSPELPAGTTARPAAAQPSDGVRTGALRRDAAAGTANARTHPDPRRDQAGPRGLADANGGALVQSPRDPNDHIRPRRKKTQLMCTRTVLIGLAATTALTLSACGHSTSTHSNATAPGGSTAPMSGHMPVQPGGHTGMSGMPSSAGNGLSGTVHGYTLSLYGQTMPGMRMPLIFAITKNGKPVAQFDSEQTKLMHVYLIRTDLTGFQHLHPAMDSRGIWSTTPSMLSAGTYRVYTQFLPHADASAGAVVLSRTMTVGGYPGPKAALPAPSPTTSVDGYTLTVTGQPKAGTETPLRISITRNGKPVTDLEPYLDSYAHVTAIHHGDLAFAHLHPAGSSHSNHGGPTLTVNAALPEPGTYRLFIQFQTAGRVHTAPITLNVR
jgi:hypothetical protein